MNKLWLKLALAFGLVTIMAIIIAMVLTNYQISSQFRRFVMHNQMMDFTLRDRLGDYYARHGSWAGVETILASMPGPGGGGPGMGRRAGMPGVILADASGRVIYSRPDGNKASLSLRERNEALPIEVQNRVVGYLFMTPPRPAELTESAQLFLSQANRSLLQAGLLAAGLGVLVGLGLARGVSAPLGRLATAARQISRGELNQRVPVQGSDEVADLAQAFNEMAAHLQQAEILRRNLVADIAHELRTPLSVIQGNLQAILDDVYPLEKAEIAGIYDDTLILGRLVNDLRELAQAEAGQLSLNIQPVELPPLLQDAAGLFADLAQEQDSCLETAVPEDLPRAAADPDRVRQVLYNLLANALRYTPAGGQITVMAEPPPGPSGFIRISVSDTGPGIPAQDLPHVFDRFWRADRSRSREQGGSGLGLAIARQLVEAQGGQIGAESPGRPGQGSRFWFTLPVWSG